MNLTLKAQCHSLVQKEYLAKCLLQEFGSSSRGIISILFDRYGSLHNPKLMEGNK